MKYTKSKLLLAAALGFVISGTAQQEVNTTNSLGQSVMYVKANDFYITPALKDWPDVDTTFQKEYKQKDFDFTKYEGLVEDNVKDPVVQSSFGEKTTMAPIVQFNGMSGSGFPPDPSGAAGPNHYVQAVNTSYRVYDKTGTALTSAKSLSTLWPGSSNLGDPIVMYDRHADRWFISQFKQSPNGILIAVSQTNDPTGAYYAYSFNLTQFPDYPKYSIWWDGYYMTSNSSHTAVVFERTKMLAGDPTAQMVSLSLPSLNSGGFRSPLPSDADGSLPPNGTPCYFFNLEDNAFGVSQDQIEIYEMTTDWATPGNTQVVSSQQLAVPAFDAVFTGGFANIAQPGTTQKIDAIQGVLMYRAQHMRWTGYNTIVLSHAVDLGSNRSGVRWYELRDANNGVWSVFQSGTYAPDNASRWMSSAAMDNYGNIGMAYAISDAVATIYPGIRFTAHTNGYTAGIMNLAESVAVDGLGSQVGIDRFGDYAHLCLDPDGETFWYTGEYFGASGSKRTYIFSFNVKSYAGLKDSYYENLNMVVSLTDNNITVNVDGIKGNEKIQIDLIGIDGKVIATVEKNPSDNATSYTFENINLNAGIYFVRVGNINFQKAQKILKY